MFGIGGFEFFLILLFAFLVFGPDRLPALAKTVGQAIAKLRSMQSEMNEVVKTEIYEPAGIDPNKNPLQALEDLGNQSLAEATKTESSKSQEDDNPYLKTFAERKAKYDAERAARKAQAEAEQAQQGGASDGSNAADKVDSQDQEAQSQEDVTVQALYGNIKPVKNEEQPKAQNEDQATAQTKGQSEIQEASDATAANAGTKGDN